MPLVDAPAANVSSDVGDLAPLDWSVFTDAAGITASAAGIPTSPAETRASAAEVGVTDIASDAAVIAADAADILADATAEPLAFDAEQQAILDFERQWWRLPGAKEQAIRDRFEMSPTRYYQTLNALLDVPEALAYDPTLVNRLRRVRSASPRARRLGPTRRTVG